MNQPPITLVNLSEQEKEKIAEISHRNMVRGITMYLIPFVIFGFCVAYSNIYAEKFGLDQKPDLREWLNVGLVFLTILPARLFVNVILRHRKSSNAWQKKVIRGKITEIKGNIITLVNQKIKLNAEDISRLKTDNEVIVSVLPSGDIVLRVEIISPKG
ncbi:MAG TPA: hypothetical protein VFJ43_13075 [Bacteroidia bacterium]|nr:hypothetical protein [Bacteroidia bacterium]